MSYPGPGGAEFTFELLVCRWAERSWPPGRDSDTDADAPPVVVARQLGTRERRWDTIVIEADPDALAARAAFGTEALDSDLLHVVRHAPAAWTWYRDALPHPGYPWRYVRAAVHRAAARGVVEKRRDGNRIQIRRIAPYPEWAARVVAIENKPDLDAAAARALADQLAHDVESGLADEVWVATAATDDAVAPALFEDLPVEAGILAFDFAGDPTARVEWHASRLDAGGDDAGGDDADGDTDGGDDGPRLDHGADPTLAGTRREIAERAYGSGWRSYLDTVRPDCRHFELRKAGGARLPWCAAKEHHQTGAECSGSCPAFEPEPPAWRTRGWPIEGGPGKGIRRLLDRQRTRERGGDGAPERGG